LLSIDGWLHRLSTFFEVEGCTEDEHLRLGHLLKVMTHLRPGLDQCHDVAGFPRTNTHDPRDQQALAPYQWTQELEHLSPPLWQVWRVSRVVAAATRWGILLVCSLTAYGLTIMAVGSARATQPVSLPPSPLSCLASLETRWEHIACT